LNSASKTITGGSGATIFSPVVLGATRTVDVASGTFTMSGIISDGGNAYGLSKTGSGTLDLSGANTFTGGLTIKAGTVQGDTSASAFGGSGTGAITLGDTTGSNAATLLVGTTGLTFANAITLATNASVGTLTIGNTGTAISTIFSGGVTGTNSFTINSNATTGTIEFSTATVNNAGTITHIGAGSGTATISAVIGTNVTGLTQNSTTSALTLSGNNSTVSGNVTISAGTLSLSGTTNLNVSGNWSNSGTFTANSSTVTLTGTSAGGTITSGGSSFYKLTQNGSGGTYTLQDNTTVSNTLTITAGTLACATKNLTVTTALSNSGLITASTGAILIPNASSGAFTFTDANNIPAATYSTLTINASGKTDTLAGIVNSTNLTITAGTLDVSSSNYALNVSGNWSNSGIFNARNGTVTLNGTLQTISGTTTFYNLTKDVSAAAADTLTFTAGSAQTISHTLTLNGASGKVLTLVSSSTPTRWVLTLPVGAAYTVNYVNAKDSDASRGLAINATNSTDSGNNLNWGFGVNSVLTLSGFNPASGATITSAPVISFTLSVAGDCYAATTNWGYANMIANSAINCAGDGTTNGVCQMTDLGTNGSKTIYFACQDTFGNKNADGTDQSVTYTLSSPSGNQIIIKGKLKTQGMVKFK
jgi:autotransporter-associated beta strand protein